MILNGFNLLTVTHIFEHKCESELSKLKYV